VLKFVLKTSMGKEYKIIYIYSPSNGVTGGPETLHSLCNIINANGGNAYMFYGKRFDIPQIYFSKYNLLKKANKIIDSPNNLFICPETDLFRFNNYRKIKKFSMFLSWDFYERRLLKNRISKNISTKLFQKIIFPILRLTKLRDFKLSESIGCSYNCQYVKEHLLQLGLPEEKLIYLCGNISKEHFVPQGFQQKENLVAYNPKKGMAFTKLIIESFISKYHFSPFVPIINMSPSQVAETLQKCKVYIDFGDFPGPERIPREAALANCNIITGLKGSSGNMIDVPIPKEYKFLSLEENIDAIINLINEMIQNYSSYVAQFDEYRRKILLQKDIFEHNIVTTFLK
jgi:hypothetical protein